MKIAIITVSANRMHMSRRELLNEILKNGHEVFVIGPSHEPECERNLLSLGVKFIGVPLNRISMNIFSEFNLGVNLYRILNKEQPDIIITYGVKMGVLGNLAGYFAGTDKLFPIFNGTGSLFQMSGVKSKIVKSLLYPLTRFTLSKCKYVFFQNPDDRDLFMNLKLVKHDKTIVVNGSGVNIERFKLEQLPSEPVFLMVARLIREKGIYEYLEAARIVKEKHPKAKFLLLGPYDNAINAIKKSDLKSYIDQGIVDYLGTTNDITQFYKKAAYYVLPSYYREGIPRSILEAMSMGRPIITTDSPGCKETVIDGVNGFLIKPRNITELAEKMVWFINNKEEAIKMGLQSRRLCEEKFNVDEINKDMLTKMELIDNA